MLRAIFSAHNYTHKFSKALLALKPRTARDTPIYLFCYHKVGTVLLSKVFRELCQIHHWDFRSLKGQEPDLSGSAEVTLFSHSLSTLEALPQPFVGVRLIRDPRDVIVSGYMYHLRTTEAWCTNQNFGTQAPIGFPQLPYSQQHRPEAWKAAYLESLGGSSYQDHLRSLGQAAGLTFEINHYGAWTTESMMAWDDSTRNVLTVKFEDLMADYDTTFCQILEHVGFSGVQLKSGLRLARRHDLSRKSAKEIEKIKHVSSPVVSKWKKYFEPEHKALFLKKFGDALIRLGYETDHNW